MMHFSSFYAWFKEPLSQLAQEDMRQTDMIRKAWTGRGKVYVYRKPHDDQREAGGPCNRARLRTSPCSLAVCSLATQAKAQGHDPFRPRLTIHQQGVAIVYPQTQSVSQHEPPWHLSRQRDGRKLLPAI